jgi:pilus assembly protein Flp/PilA
MMTIVRYFKGDESGATAIEYALIGAIVSLAILAGFTQFANEVEYLMGNPESALREALRDN